VDNETIAAATDLREKGRRTAQGQVTLDRRLYVQFFGFGECRQTGQLIPALVSSGLNAVLYEDLNDPFGVGLVTYSEEPDYFMHSVRTFVQQSPFGNLSYKPEYAMFGRTYARGFEPDIEEAIIRKPARNIQNEQLHWAVWYPLRRTGSFELLSPEEQRDILTEHGKIGHAFGRIGAGHDVRLDCHGLNKDDNDFVIGVLGPELHPLSVIVQTMRKSQQTSRYIERLGPFFTGRVIWRSAPVNPAPADEDEHGSQVAVSGERA